MLFGARDKPKPLGLSLTFYGNRKSCFKKLSLVHNIKILWHWLNRITQSGRLSQAMCMLVDNRMEMKLLETHKFSAKDWIPSGPAPVVVQHREDV